MALGLTGGCGVLTVVSCIFTLIATLLHAVAFGTHAWIVSDGTSPFVSFGFHEVCFDYCQDPYCPASGSQQRYYSGCTWLFHRDYFEEIWWWLMPYWFEPLRNIAIVNVPLTLCCFVLMAICCCLVYAGRYTPEPNRTRQTITQALLFLGAALILVSAILNMVILLQWYTNGFQLGWMPMPEKNSFGYSFWLDFAGTLLLVLAFLCALMAAVFKTILIHSDKDPRYSEEMMYGRGIELTTR